ncbi:MAG: host attachment protein [Tepidisphaeraceae bacterium]
MRNNWIVVADAGRAKLYFKTEQDEHPVLLREFNNISGRARERMFGQYPIGAQTALNGDNRRGLLLGLSDPDEVHSARFASDLCDLLEQSAVRGAYDRLVLVAPAPFLGMLRQEIGPAARKRLAASIAKNLVEVTAQKLGDQLGDIMEFEKAVMA